MAARLHIDTFTLGEWMTNCYVLSTDASPRCWIIDAGFEPRPLIDHIKQKGLEPEKLLLTHAHVDHIAGLHEVRRAWPKLPIYVHEAEAGFLADPMLNLSVVLDEPITGPSPTGYLEHGQRLELDGLSFELRHTPGHSPGGVSFYQADHGQAIVGDALFAGSVGRVDFPTSDGALLMRSIREQLLSLPDETTIHPGHGPTSTIGQERAGNPFLRP